MQVFRNARIVAGAEVVHGSLLVQEGRIAALHPGSCTTGMDLEGDYLIPGLVELHTDNFERHLMPRPSVHWPALPALMAHDAELAAAGITTVYDALGVGDSDMAGVRGRSLDNVVRAIDQASDDGLLRAEHRLHVRLELPAPNVVELFAPFDGNARVGLISLMDHTPGQRQWENLEQARVYYCGRKGWSEEKFDQKVAEAAMMRERFAEPHRRHFVELAHSRGIALASHDDTLAEHVEQAHAEGIEIAEFPTRIEAARAAREKGMSIVMGAPNVVRGGSHSGNVAAAELARLGLLDLLSSDYVPASLLMAAFRLISAADFTLPQAVASVTLNPAHALGLEDRGTIAPGMRADLVRVRQVADQPVVRGVWREGRQVA